MAVGEGSASNQLYVLKDVVQTYDGRPVLHLSRWSLRKECILGLMGPNGSGKSTLLRLLGFIERPHRGEILFQGKTVSSKTMHPLRLQVSLLPQPPCLLDRTVAENVAYGLAVRGVRKDRAARVREALLWVGLDPDHFGKRFVRGLSSGEARRTALAARLVLRPQVLLLDEPTAEIDEDSARLVHRAVLHARSAWGATVVVSSHDRKWLEGLCDELYALDQGRISGPVFEEPTEQEPVGGQKTGCAV